MNTAYTTDQRFEKLDLTQAPLPAGEYEGCEFSGCDFSGTDLGGFRFVDCAFSGCNLSNARLQKTVFRDAIFKSCKMLGLRFDDCSGFGLSFRFEDCVLSHSSFHNTSIKQTVFAVCDFAGAAFDGTNLEKTDFRTAINYNLDPENNRLKKARFSVDGLAGLLGKYGIVIEA
jgi:uncharacterized protein YjbI with pentapeptide repeats